jgi:regulator of sigma E protease
MPQLTGYWSLLYQIPVGLLGLSFMVFVHEFGHFWAAKKMGVRVHTFSIGFGKKLIRWKRGETEYCLSAIPFGGYVAMAGENPDEGGYGATDEFQQKSVPARIFIAAAGPAANLIFAFAILFGLYMAGVDEPKPGLTVGHVEESSAGAKAGVRAGDEILAYADQPMRDWEQFTREAALSGEGPYPLRIRRDGRDTVLTLAPEMNPKFGIALTGIVGELEVRVHKVMPGRSADKAGLRAGDRILRVDGTPVPTPVALIDMINGSEGRALTFTLARDGAQGDKRLEVPVTPAYDAELKRWLIGIQPAAVMPTMRVTRGPVESARAAAATTYSHATMVFRTFGRIASGDVHVKALSGPIGIVQMISGSLREGFRTFLEFTAMLNTNLGVLNLLPLAITDGGLILLLLIEAVRRKPVSARVQGAINRAGMAFFLALFLFITFQDILRVPMFLD